MRDRSNRKTRKLDVLHITFCGFLNEIKTNILHEFRLFFLKLISFCCLGSIKNILTYYQHGIYMLPMILAVLFSLKKIFFYICSSMLSSFHPNCKYSSLCFVLLISSSQSVVQGPSGL